MSPIEYSAAITPPPSAILVLEKSSFWSAELNRRFVREGVSIRTRFRETDVFSVLATGTVGQLLIGLEIEPPVTLRLLTRQRQILSGTRVMVLLPAEQMELEWTLREIGAHEVIYTPVSADHLTSIVRRGLTSDS